MAKATLDNLRAIFREEFDDLLHVVGRQTDRAERSTSAEETAAAAAAEVRRAVHTLKGAARAVGYPALEAECHRLETAIEALRAAGTPSSADVLAQARETITVMNRFAPMVHGGSPASPVAAAPPATVANVKSGGAPAAATATATATAASDDAVAMPGPSAQETVRVDAGALAAILDASENLVLEMSRGVERTSRHTVEATTADLLRELDHVRRLAAAYESTSGSHAAGEVRRRLDRAFGTARTLSAASEALATNEAVAWNGASARAKTVAASARGLRQIASKALPRQRCRRRSMPPPARASSCASPATATT